MLHNQARLFGESLVERHVLARDVLEDMLEESSRTGLELPALLLQKGMVGEKDLAAANAHALGIRFVDFEETMLQPELADVLAEPVARANQAVPVVIEDVSVVIAFAQPENHSAVAEVSAAVHSGSGLRVIAAGADPAEVAQALDASYGDGHAILVGEEMDRDLFSLFQRMVDADASDLHLAVGQPPILRILGDLHRITEFPPLTGSRVRELIYSILDKNQQERFEKDHELDTNHTVPGLARFRVNVYLKRNEIAASLRLIPLHVVPFDSLGLPESIKMFAHMPRGLVLVTGPTGSGKTTTLASILDIVNTTRSCHVITIEEPIEFVHESKMSLMSQRDVGSDTASFARALRQALRQDPDVILVGEMRDLETISTAVSAAETGHLVFATLHTQDAAQSIDRIVDAFPAEQQSQVRIQVAATLQGIVSQTLIPRADGAARVAAAEVMMATPAIRNLIRDGKIHQVFPMIQSGRRYGMCTLDESLGYLVSSGVITMDQALLRCRDANELRRYSGVAATA